MTLTLAAVGAVLVFAFAVGVLFRRHRVPDIPWLLGLGGLMVYAGVLEPAMLARWMPPLTALALLMVIFDGAMEVGIDSLRSHGRTGLSMAGVTFALTTVLCAVVGVVAGLSWTVAILLGMCFGGAGIVIIIPMARRLGLSKDGMGVLLMEAVTSDLLVIVVISASASLLLAGLGASFAVTVSKTFLVGALGAPFGWLWGKVLDRVPMENTYAVTLAVLMLLYALVEHFGGSGPVAALLFGLLVGHAVRADRARRHTGERLVDFHHELMFFVRAFFFVGLGATIRWELLGDQAFLLTGLALCAALALARAVATAWTVRGLPGKDRLTVALMFPMGLVTAAASLLPQTIGVPGTDVLDEYAAVVIVISNIVAGLAVFVLVRRPA